MTPLLGAWVGLARSLVIYYGQPWRTRALRRLTRDLVGPGDLAFDLGAHVGNRSLALMRAGARVVAIEPNPTFARFLEWQASGRAMTVVRKAVSSTAGKSVLRVSSKHPTVSTTATDWRDRVSDDPGFRHVVWDDALDVETVTLDMLIADHGRPDFVKIDVEGSELDILCGLSTPVRMIAFEYLPVTLDLALRCLERLGQLGNYQFNLVAGESHRFELSTWQGEGAFRQTLRTNAEGGRHGDVYARLVHDPEDEAGS